MFWCGNQNPKYQKGEYREDLGQKTHAKLSWANKADVGPHVDWFTNYKRLLFSFFVSIYLGIYLSYAIYLISTNL